MSLSYAPSLLNQPGLLIKPMGLCCSTIPYESFSGRIQFQRFQIGRNSTQWLLSELWHVELRELASMLVATMLGFQAVGVIYLDDTLTQQQLASRRHHVPHG